QLREGEQSLMIECFWATTPNSRRVTMMLEECGLPYVRRVGDLAAGEHMGRDFHSLNPSGSVHVHRIPSDGREEELVVTQSGAICLYLAQRSGRLLPVDERQRALTQQWFAWALSDLSGTATALYRLSRGGTEMQSALTMMQERMHL